MRSNPDSSLGDKGRKQRGLSGPVSASLSMVMAYPTLAYTSMAALYTRLKVVAMFRD